MTVRRVLGDRGCTDMNLLTATKLLALHQLRCWRAKNEVESILCLWNNESLQCSPSALSSVCEFCVVMVTSACCLGRLISKRGGTRINHNAPMIKAATLTSDLGKRSREASVQNYFSRFMLHDAKLLVQCHICAHGTLNIKQEYLQQFLSLNIDCAATVMSILIHFLTGRLYEHFYR